AGAKMPPPTRFSFSGKRDMDIDTDKIDEAVLALLYLTRCDETFGAASWKSHDWDALNRVHEKGYKDISATPSARTSPSRSPKTEWPRLRSCCASCLGSRSDCERAG